jgi:hypothetical protein
MLLFRCYKGLAFCVRVLLLISREGVYKRWVIECIYNILCVHWRHLSSWSEEGFGFAFSIAIRCISILLKYNWLEDFIDIICIVYWAFKVLNILSKRFLEASTEVVIKSALVFLLELLLGLLALRFCVVRGPTVFLVTHKVVLLAVELWLI